MFTDEEALRTEIETLARKYDASAEVLVANGNKATPEAAQTLQVVTFAVLAAPGNVDLRNALIGFGMHYNNEVELVGFGIDLQASIRIDILQMQANIYYKGITYVNS